MALNVCLAYKEGFMQKPHTDKKFYELGVKEADHNMRLLWSDAPQKEYGDETITCNQNC